MTFVQEGSLAMQWHERIKSRLKLRGASARVFACRPNCSFRCRSAGPPLGQASFILAVLGAVHTFVRNYGTARILLVNEAGLPMGLQIIAAPRRDADLLAVAAL